MVTKILFDKIYDETYEKTKKLNSEIQQIKSTTLSYAYLIFAQCMIVPTIKEPYILITQMT